MWLRQRLDYRAYATAVDDPLQLGSIGDFVARRDVPGEAGDCRLLVPTNAQP
jgi:hypothetical protein